MAIRSQFRSLLLALAVAIAAGAAFAGPAAAKSKNGSWNHPIYNDRQGWVHVDRNRDGIVSKSEWKWAEKHGYDRLNGVPKKHLTRGEYQRHLNAYLDSRQRRSWQHQADDRQRSRDDNRWRAQQQPWYYNPNGGHGKH